MHLIRTFVFNLKQPLYERVIGLNLEYMNVLLEFTSFRASTSAVGNIEPVLTCSIPNNNPSTSKMMVPTRNGKYDWYAMLPSLETLRNREHFRSKPSSSQRKSYIMNVLGREVIFFFKKLGLHMCYRVTQKPLL